MKNVVSLLVLLTICIGCLTAQAVWDEDLILRQDYRLDWARSLAGTPDGGTLVVYTQGGENHRGVWLRKIAADNQITAAPILIYEDDSNKSNPTIISSPDGSYYVRWTVSGTGIMITKVDMEGLPIWQPAVQFLSLPSVTGFISTPDPAGGLYLCYNRHVEGYSTDIWLQHLDASGTPLIPGEGIELTHDVLQEDLSFVHLTSDGGILLCNALVSSSVHNYRLIRIRPDHTIDWQTQFTTDSSDPYTWVRSVLSSDNTTFTIIWTQTVNGVANLLMQRFGLDGVMLFPDPISLYTGETSGSIYSSTVLCSDNSIMTGIHRGTNVLPITNHLQKNSLSGELLWTNVSPVPDSVISIYGLSADQDGGAYFGYIYMRDYGTSYRGSGIQHFDSSGQPLLPGFGKVVIPNMSYDEALYQSIRFSLNKFTGVWLTSLAEKKGLYYYVCDANADLLTPLKTPLMEVLGGSITSPGMIARGSDILTFWRDSRFVTPTLSAYKFYYQITDPQGNNILSPDGEVLIEDGYSVSSKLVPVSLANGETRIIYCTDSANSSKLIVQSIDAEGNVAWDENGITLINPQYSANISNICAFAVENDLYIAWSMYDANEVTRTYAQRLVGTTPMWGANGLMISSGITGNHLVETPIVFKDHYLALQVLTFSPGRKVCWATHLDLDGSISPAWQPTGLIVDDHAGANSSGYSVVGGVAWNKLFLAYKLVQDEENAQYSYSLLDIRGHTLLDHQPLINSTYDETSLMLDTRLGLDYSAKLIDWITGDVSYVYNALDNSGQPLFEQTTVATTHQAFSYSPSIVSLDPALRALYWYSGSNVYMGTISAIGEYTPLANDAPVITKCKISPISAVLGSDLYLCWGDYKSSVYSYYGTELRLRRYSFVPVHTIDQEAPTFAPGLTCYPNPFNPVTNIAFEMESPGKALLQVYNLRGQLVQTLADTHLDAGKHHVVWNGKDSSGRDAASGVYFIRLSTPTSKQTTKALLMK